MLTTLKTPYRITLGIALFAVTLMNCGCGMSPRAHLKRVDISASVTQDGQPLSGLLIDFSNDENGEAYGGTLDSQGQLRLQGVAVGTYRVTLQIPPGDPVPDGPRKESRPRPVISRQFQAPQTSPLVALVSANETRFAYELRDVLASK